MTNLRLAFYGDDFTGSTDALEQLALAGLRTVLFIDVPSPAQLRRLGRLDAVGVAGLTRTMRPAAMTRMLTPAFKKLKRLRPRHVHYKVCSTFDSSPTMGSIGHVIDLAHRLFRQPFIPLLVGAPPLGRYCAFGNLFARYGIGSTGAIHRLDRHPAVSRHPVTPMREADLRLHLARQSRRRVALLDVLALGGTLAEARTGLSRLLESKPDLVLFDALTDQHLAHVGALIDDAAHRVRPLFSVGSSAVEMALGLHWATKRARRASARPRKVSAPVSQLLVGSGSCSPVTSGQIDWALKHGFTEVSLNALALGTASKDANELQRAIECTIKLLRSGRSVIVHTTRTGSNKHVASRLRAKTSAVLGTAIGRVLRQALAQHPCARCCVAGGDTSSFAARALGIEALEVASILTPGAPLCHARAPGSPANGIEVVFKGGQVGAENYFGLVLEGRS